MRRFRLPAALFAGAVGAIVPAWLIADSATPAPRADLEWQAPNEKLQAPFAAQQPIRFVTASSDLQQWEKLPQFWNEVSETVNDPASGNQVTRKAVVIKVPLGLTSVPPVPAENPMSVAKWALGKQLYFDKSLSSNNSVSCASCHDPARGYTDQSKVSTGINGQMGGISSPTVINTVYNAFQFWDGRAAALEDQAQGPVGNPKEMFGGQGVAWDDAVLRVRSKPEYAGKFEAVFGAPATRDSMAKAIAAYERTVLSGNSIADRAELASQIRSEKEGVAAAVTAADFEKAIKDAMAKNDTASLSALQFNPAQDQARVGDFAKSLANGRALFFGKARCNSCHVGENYTDNTFHNLGVGVKNGVLPPDESGRFARLPLGHKNLEFMGAFKTPTLRSLLTTGPYMHDGGEATLEAVVDFYDRGGNANEFLDVKMRDIVAEQAAMAGKTDVPGAVRYGNRVIVPLKLNLTPTEKKDLVLFIRALQGDPIDPIVADPAR